MPTYLYRCESGHETETIKLMSEHTKTITCPDCGQVAKSVIFGGSSVRVDNMPSYKCPVTDQIVTSRRQRNEIMRRHDLVEMGDSKGVHR